MGCNEVSCNKVLQNELYNNVGYKIVQRNGL